MANNTQNNANARAFTFANSEGVMAGANAHVARVEAGVKDIPFLNAHAEAVGASAQAGATWNYTGVSAGAHLGEVQAGPFAVRAGAKFGVGIRNGVPEVDMGPVSCSVM
jgi:hypothetical protein